MSGPALLKNSILPEFNRLPLSITQHGFHPHRSTTATFLLLTHKVVSGSNQQLPPHRAVTVSLDFSKAFDTVNHTTLLVSPTNTTFRHNAVCWLSVYLKGRMISCRYNNITSLHRHMIMLVPQSSRISSVLFNHTVHDYPNSDHLTSSYTDNFTDSHCHSDFHSLASALTDHVAHVSEWAEQKGLTLFTQKPTVSLFSPRTQQTQRHPHVILNSSTSP